MAWTSPTDYLGSSSSWGGSPISSGSWTANPTFTNPSFGIDSTGQFSGVGDALASNPLGSSGGGMFPLAGPIIGAVGAIGGGMASGKGAKSAADRAAEAARYQAEQVTQANRENLYGGFGFEKAGQEYGLVTGEPIKRFNAMQDAFANRALEQGFGAQAERRQQMAQNLAERQAGFSGFRTPVMGRFL